MGIVGPSIYRASIHEGELAPFERLALAIVFRAVKDMGNSHRRQAAQDYLRSDEVMFYIAVAGKRDYNVFLARLSRFLAKHGVSACMWSD